MAGGPMVNIAIAFGLFTLLFATYGNPRDEVVEPVVAAVPACVVPVEEQGRACAADDPPTPAKEAGLQPGDEILSFNGTPVHATGTACSRRSAPTPTATPSSWCAAATSS